MTLGKKIGGGFCIVILLTVILGLWAIQSMNQGAEVAETIANDRLPRLIHWSELQNDLMESSYFAQEYFQNGNEEEINKTFEFLGEFSQNINSIKQLNSKIFYANTAKAIDKAEKDAGTYGTMLRDDQKLYLQSEKLVDEMMSAANEVMEQFEKLIHTMSGTLESFIDSGDARSSRSYARNMAAANAVYAKIAAVYQDLLVAERNNDLESFSRVEERLPDIQRQAMEVDKGLLRDECHKMFADTMNKYEKFATISAQVAATLKQFIEKGKIRYNLFHEMYGDILKMVKLTTDNSNKYSTQAASSLSTSTMVVTILLIIVLIIGIIVAVVITRSIVRPLSTTQRFAEGVAGGDLERDLDVHTSDETGRLADSLRSMVAALKKNISEARVKSEEAEKATEKATAAMARAEEAARQAESAKREGMLAAANQLEKMVEIISSASTQLSAQIEQSDRGASESAQRLQEAATAMNEMNATVQEVARNAGSASEASSETRHKAQAGQQVVREVVESIADVHHTSLVLKDDMAQLNERAQDINRIMGVISDIADQTNLLALNAAIEAARAGEAGRGFAVVADEVRKLAEKTMTSTQDVSNAIHAIQESTSKSMSAVDNAVTSIGKATELANQSGGALEEIVSTVESTSDQVQAIAAASEEQSAASEEINRSITEVNDMSRLTADAMREASVAVSDLADQAHRLTELINDMKKA